MRWFFQSTAIATLALLATAAGCHPVLHTPGKSLFAPRPMSPDSCALEVFFIRVPFDDAEANQTLWEEVDELHFAPKLRQRLQRNGFRAGLQSSQISTTLAHLLELSTQPPIAQEDEQIELVDLAVKPRVLRSRLHLHTGQPSKIVVSGVYEQLPLLVCQCGEVGGKTYEQAQGVLSLKSFPQTDGSVQIEVVPEIQYGQSRKNWTADQSGWRSDFGKPEREFTDLALSAKLSPGSILLLTSLPDRRGSLGHYFFTEKDGRLEQKLLLIRLAQTQHDDLFTPPDVLPLEVSGAGITED
ncbi:MAG: hypothetical protein JXB10_17315 [Pirellulales bacterium]|nr:hypothetical protein [Pirellulales bacterium]